MKLRFSDKTRPIYTHICIYMYIQARELLTKIRLNTNSRLLINCDLT